MNANPFFDTNLLIYTLSQNDRRADVARNLLAGGGILSVQVVNEFVSVARRKLSMAWPGIREALVDFRAFCPVPAAILPKIHESALKISERYGYRIYDALITAAALQASCKLLYSENMRDGRTIEGLTIRNPF